MSGRDQSAIADRIDRTSGLRPVDAKVLKALALAADFGTGKNARLSVPTIVKRTELPKRSVERSLSNLRRNHYIRARRWHRHATTYDLDYTRLAPSRLEATVIPAPAPSRIVRLFLSAKLAVNAFLVRQIGGLTWRTRLAWGFVRQIGGPTNVQIYTHTPRAVPLPGLIGEVPRCRDPAHAWHGTVCVPSGLHQEFLRKRHTLAWLLAFYARTCAAIPGDAKIAVDDYTFWRAALKAELAGAPPQARAPTGDPRSPVPDNELFARAREERRQRYGGDS